MRKRLQQQVQQRQQVQQQQQVEQAANNRVDLNMEALVRDLSIVSADKRQLAKFVALGAHVLGQTFLDSEEVARTTICAAQKADSATSNVQGASQISEELIRQMDHAAQDIAQTSRNIEKAGGDIACQPVTDAERLAEMAVTAAQDAGQNAEVGARESETIEQGAEIPDDMPKKADQYVCMAHITAKDSQQSQASCLDTLCTQNQGKQDTSVENKNPAVMMSSEHPNIGCGTAAPDSSRLGEAAQLPEKRRLRRRHQETQRKQTVAAKKQTQPRQPVSHAGESRSALKPNSSEVDVEALFRKLYMICPDKRQLAQLVARGAKELGLPCQDSEEATWSANRATQIANSTSLDSRGAALNVNEAASGIDSVVADGAQTVGAVEKTANNAADGVGDAQQVAEVTEEVVEVGRDIAQGATEAAGDAEQAAQSLGQQTEVSGLSSEAAERVHRGASQGAEMDKRVEEVGEQTRQVARREGQDAGQVAELATAPEEVAERVFPGAEQVIVISAQDPDVSDQSRRGGELKAQDEGHSMNSSELVASAAEEDAQEGVREDQDDGLVARDAEQAVQGESAKASCLLFCAETQEEAGNEFLSAVRNKNRAAKSMQRKASVVNDDERKSGQFGKMMRHLTPSSNLSRRMRRRTLRTGKYKFLGKASSWKSADLRRVFKRGPDSSNSCNIQNEKSATTLPVELLSMEARASASSSHDTLGFDDDAAQCETSNTSLPTLNIEAQESQLTEDGRKEVSVVRECQPGGGLSSKATITGSEGETISSALAKEGETLHSLDLPAEEEKGEEKVVVMEKKTKSVMVVDNWEEEKEGATRFVDENDCQKIVKTASSEGRKQREVVAETREKRNDVVFVKDTERKGEGIAVVEEAGRIVVAAGKLGRQTKDSRVREVIENDPISPVQLVEQETTARDGPKGKTPDNALEEGEEEMLKLFVVKAEELFGAQLGTQRCDEKKVLGRETRRGSLGEENRLLLELMDPFQSAERSLMIESPLTQSSWLTPCTISSMGGDSGLHFPSVEECSRAFHALSSNTSCTSSTEEDAGNCCTPVDPPVGARPASDMLRIQHSSSAATPNAFVDCPPLLTRVGLLPTFSCNVLGKLWRGAAVVKG